MVYTITWFIVYFLCAVKPNLAELALSLRGLTGAEVVQLALQLGVEYDTLRKIDESNKEISNKLLSAMNTWLISDTEASWGKVMEALIAIEKNVLAQQIETKFCSPQQLQATATNPSISLVPSGEYDDIQS